MSVPSIRPACLLPLLLAVIAPTALASPAHADNNRLNLSVAKMVYVVQHQAGCTNNVQINPQLQLAAQWHSVDVRDNRALDGDTGSDGSSPQDRANAAGYRGQVQETVAINPALSITSLEVINQWYGSPEQLTIMQNCANSEVGVWSENSLDRTVLVAMYGHPG
ncbi:CAP domain-containing protein [Mycolicibacterium stellerae]|uniref:CAP domain-containing protein n=1 Tax=Mycolicibacterium stellerae TaxID=2358193 RepID=UPI0013DDCD45|nr:CAP domain-containing protein [Mycolicibacterium stellerae]